MDHYKVLGLSKNASKDEIKEAFRNLAMKLHPDKHSQSPNAVRDSATLRFKQVSEAYEVLIDDRKRADYNIRRGSGGFRSRSGGGGSGGGGGGGYGYNYDYYYARNSSYRSRRSSGSYAGNNFEGLVSKIEIVLRFLTTRAFLLNLAFAGALVGGTMIIDTSRDALWKQRNSGKSFEEAMEIIEKAKEHKDKK